MAIRVDGTYASNYAAMMLSVAPQNGLEYQGPRREVGSQIGHEILFIKV